MLLLTGYRTVGVFFTLFLLQQKIAIPVNIIAVVTRIKATGTAADKVSIMMVLSSVVGMIELLIVITALACDDLEEYILED